MFADVSCGRHYRTWSSSAAAWAASIVIALAPASRRPDAFASEPPPFGQQIQFNIPAEPLDVALTAYSAQSGVDLLYVQGLTGDRMSAPVVGRFTEAVALQMLLQGSGLTSRFPGHKAAIIYVIGRTPPPLPHSVTPSVQLDMAQVHASVRIGGPDHKALDTYARDAASEIGRVLSADPDCRGEGFHIILAVSLDETGRIDGVHLIRGSGTAKQDDRIRGILAGRSLSKPPPPGLNQAIQFDFNWAPGVGPG
jgi:hypothetical protein